MSHQFFSKITVFLLIASFQSFSQPSGEEYRRTAVIDGNAIKTVITNSGIIGQPGEIGPRATWNGIYNTYFADMSILLGLELPIRDYINASSDTLDGIPDTIHSVIITPVDRPGGGEGGLDQAWGFEPIDSFFNPNITDPTKGIALSNFSETWPEIWPDHPEYGSGVWNGLYGPDNFIGTQEAYYLVDDEEDEEMFERHEFLPDSTNPNIRGHGLRVSVRYVQLDNPLFKDILFKVYDIKNESLHNYDKLVFGGLTGTYIGGETPEWSDDVSLYYPLDNIIISYDFDEYINPSANPNWEGEVGKFGEAFIHAPAINKIASFQYFVPAGDITMADDEDMWRRMKPGFYDYPSSIIWQDSIPIAIRGDDGDYIWSSEYFTLDAGETKQFATVLAFGYTNGEVLNKIRLAEALYHSNFDTLAIHEVVNITSHSYHKNVSGNDLIEWQSQNSGGSVEILYSADGGNNWKSIVKNAPNTGSYLWNSEDFDDGSFCLLRIYIKNDEGFIYGLNTSNYFTVNNDGNGSPYIEILNEEFAGGGTFTEENYDFNLLVGDPENDPLMINVYYKTQRLAEYIYSYSINAASDTLSQVYNINFKVIPNSPDLQIQLEVTDGDSSYSDNTLPFDKNTSREILPGQNFEVISGFAEVPIEIRVIDSTQFRGDEYIISFADTLHDEDYKTFSVYNNTLNEYTVFNEPFYPFSESSLFDGMILYTEDVKIELDPVRSRWNDPDPQNLEYIFSQFTFPSADIYGSKDPFDFIIPFSNEYNDSSNYLDQIFGANAPPANTNINFKVFRAANDELQRTQFAFTESSNFRQDTLSHLDQISIANPEETEISWKINFIDPDSSSNIPSGGDTLYVFTSKGLSRYDTLRVFDLPVSVDGETIIPLTYSLSQNFPNPFNPSTTIRFQLPESGKVSLIIYDILGRKVKTLVDEFKVSGNYDVNFNASSLASGVYLYRLNVNEYVAVKKMILLK